MKVCVVTPARNEVENLAAVAAKLRGLADSSVIQSWTIVDDGSTDGTGDLARTLSADFPIRVLSKLNDGGLSGGSAFSSFFFGADDALARNEVATHVMKLDADALLSSDFFLSVQASDTSGLSGGIAQGLHDREQSDLVPGFCKIYSRAAYDVVRTLPAAIGLDVIDQVAIRHAGLPVVVTRNAHVRLLRSIGYSEGLVRGRKRNGIVSRWVGYHPLYFQLKVLRYVFRAPVGLGAAAMVWSYLRAGAGPYPTHLKRTFRIGQRDKLAQLLRKPRTTLVDLYGTASCGDTACCRATSHA